MGVPFTVFPLHWENNTLFEIKNYLDFQYEMIHSNNSNEDEDYWYANKLCRVSTGRVYPCQEIYFKRNTEIPLRTTHIEQKIMSTAIEQIITNYKVLKIGEPDQKYFDSIPKNWSLTCADEMFQIKYDPKSTWLFVDQTLEIKVSLRAAPHRINGNDTLTIQWKASQYNDHFKLTPKQLYFNSQNYHEKQILKVTRIANGPDGYFIPIFHGGGFEPLLASNFAFTVFGTIG